MQKVAIVGMGRVGAALAYNLGLSQAVDQILAIDHNQQLAEMQTKDLLESFIIEGSKTRIETNDYTNLADVAIIVITASAPVNAVKDRLELFDSSTRIMKDVVKSSLKAGFKGIFLVASNPVDLMCAVVAKESGFSPNQIVGSGTILDNARLINELSSLLKIDPQFIESDTIGEHGNSIVPVYSGITINKQPLDEYLIQHDIVVNFDQMTELVTTGGPKIFNVKGATEFGIASSLTRIIRALINDADEVLTVTNLLSDPSYPNIYIPSHAVVNRRGATPIDLTEMSSLEAKAFAKSVALIESYNQLIE